MHVWGPKINSVRACRPFIWQMLSKEDVSTTRRFTTPLNIWHCSISVNAQNKHSMSASHFSVKRHVLPCQHIREYPEATASGEDDTLQLAIKQYVPLNNPNSQPGDVTIIAAHAVGIPKVRTLTRL